MLTLVETCPGRSSTVEAVKGNMRREATGPRVLCSLVCLRTSDNSISVAVRRDLASSGVADHDLGLRRRVPEPLPQLVDAAAVADGHQGRPELLHLCAT